MDETLRRLREELARCELESQQAKHDVRASDVRLRACLIRLGRAQKALEDYEAMQKETR